MKRSRSFRNKECNREGFGRIVRQPQDKSGTGRQDVMCLSYPFTAKRSAFYTKRKAIEGGYGGNVRKHRQRYGHRTCSEDDAVWLNSENTFARWLDQAGSASRVYACTCISGQTTDAPVIGHAFRDISIFCFVE